MEEVLSFVQPGDEGVFAKRTMPKILCCMCGIQMDANPANMCVNCLRTQVDITEGIPKQLILHNCRGCNRYLRPPWVACDLESKELLAICLKKINGLNKVKLVDAGFIWTEPHSRHIKVKLTIQKDVLNGVKLQQVFAVDFAVQNQQCDACQRSYTDHHWRAQVQVRQKVEHKKTFYLLEQLILKHNAHEKCSGVEQVPAGVDFNFLERSHALKFIDFLAAVVPTRAKQAKQLISEDIHSAVKNYKFNYAVEIVPLCKDDVVVLPKATAAAMGNMNPLALVFRVASVVFMVDPRTLQIGELNGDKYWREPFRALTSTSQLVEFTVLDVTPVTVAPLTGAALRRKQGKRAAKAILGAAGASNASVAGSVKGGAGSKRGREDDDGRGSVVGASSVGPGSTLAGGFTGAVSLAGGSVQFNGAMSVASTVTGGPKGKLLLADAEVVRTRDLGASDERFIVRTHLGNILRPGDTVLGYDLTQANYSEADVGDTTTSNSTGGSSGKSYSKAKKEAKGGHGGAGRVDMPDVVLVRKVHKTKEQREREEREDRLYNAAGEGAAAGAGAKDDAMDGAAAGAGGSAKPRKPKERLWKLKRLEQVVPTKHSEYSRRGDEERAAAEYEEFLAELEADPSLRKGLNLYKNKAAIEAAAAAKAEAAAARAQKVQARLEGQAADDDDDDEDEEDEDGDDQGAIGLEELLDEMDLGAGAAGAHGQGRSGSEDSGEGEQGRSGAWGGVPSSVEPGFEGKGTAGASAAGAAGAASGGAGEDDDAPEYDDGGLGLTKAGRKELKDVPEDEEDEDDL